MDHLRHQVNRLFEETMPRPQASSDVAAAGWTPAVDIRETTQAIVLEADLPGLRKEDIEVSLNGDTLSLSGARLPTETEEPARHHRAERSLGRFHRSFALEVPADPEAVEASLPERRAADHRAQSRASQAEADHPRSRLSARANSRSGRSSLGRTAAPVHQ